MTINNPEQLVDLEAERAVLAGVLLDNDALAIVEAIVAAADFWHPAHGTILEAFVALERRGEPIDVITAVAELRDRERLNAVGGAQYLGALTDEIPTVAHVASHSRIVADLAARRRVREEAQAVAQRAANGSLPLDAVVAQAADKLQAAARGGHTPTTQRTVGEALERVAQRTQAGEEHGFPLPWKSIDRALRGLRGGRQYIVAGRTAMGKSSWVRNLATSLAAPRAWFPAGHPSSGRAPVPVLFIALEMPTDENSIQVMASCIGASGEQVEKGWLTNHQMTAYSAARNVLETAPLVFDDQVEAAARICALARRFKAEHGPFVLIVDYLQLCGPEGLMLEGAPTRERQVAAISRAFKRLAMKLDIPAVLLSQLSRKEGKDEECPKLSDLRESGSVEQDADAVIFLHGKRPTGGDTTQAVSCTIAKVRGARAGVSVPLILHRAPTRFEESPDAQYELLAEEAGFEVEGLSSPGGDAE